MRIYLARMLGAHKRKISDVVRDTGVNRGILTRMYYEKVERIELNVLDILCEYFGCTIADLLEPQKPEAKNDTEAELG